MREGRGKTKERNLRVKPKRSYYEIRGKVTIS